MNSWHYCKKQLAFVENLNNMALMFMNMRRLSLIILFCFALGSCHEPDALEIKELGGPIGKILLTSDIPFSLTKESINYYRIDVGSAGGEFTVVASFPENEGVSLNDHFIVGWSDDQVPNHLVSINRTKLNEYQSSYVIKVKPNSFGKSYECSVLMFDESRVDKTGKPMTSRATLVIRQAK